MNNNEQQKKLRYGELSRIAKRLNVQPWKVRNVRKRMKNGFDNFFSEDNRAIYEELLKLNNE